MPFLSTSRFRLSSLLSGRASLSPNLFLPISLLYHLPDSVRLCLLDLHDSIRFIDISRILHLIRGIHRLSPIPTYSSTSRRSRSRASAFVQYLAGLAPKSSDWESESWRIMDHEEFVRDQNGTVTPEELIVEPQFFPDGDPATLLDELVFRNKVDSSDNLTQFSLESTGLRRLSSSTKPFSGPLRLPRPTCRQLVKLASYMNSRLVTPIAPTRPTLGYISRRK